LNYVLSNRNVLDLVRGRRNFKAKLYSLQNRENAGFFEEIMGGFDELKKDFWAGQDSAIKEESVGKDIEILEKRNNQAQIGVGGGKRIFQSSKVEDSQKVVDRNLKKILAMKIKFDVEIQKDSNQSRCAGNTGNNNGLLNKMFFGVDLNNWKEEEAKEEDGQNKKIEVEQELIENPAEREDFLEFDEKQIQIKKDNRSKQKKKQQMIDKIESVNLPENLKLKLMNTVVGKTSILLNKRTERFLCWGKK
jgi:hypothetical protein